MSCRAERGIRRSSDSSAAPRNDNPAFDPNGSVFLDAIKANQQWYVEHGDVKNPIDVDKIYDPQYLDYAVSTLGKR